MIFRLALDVSGWRPEGKDGKNVAADRLAAGGMSVSCFLGWRPLLRFGRERKGWVVPCSSANAERANASKRVKLGEEIGRRRVIGWEVPPQNAFRVINRLG